MSLPQFVHFARPDINKIIAERAVIRACKYLTGDSPMRKKTPRRKTEQRLKTARTQLIAIREEVAAGYRRQDFSYHLYVPVSELPKDVSIPVGSLTSIINDKGEATEVIDFVMATWHRTLQSGKGDKGDLWRLHEEQARRKAWEIIREAFPETKELNIDKLPTVWVHYPRPKRISNQVKRVEGEL